MKPSPLSLTILLVASLGLARASAAQSPAAAADGPPPLSAEQRQAMAQVKSEAEKRAALPAVRLAATAKLIYENILRDQPDEELRRKLEQELNASVAEVLAVKGQSFRDAVKVLTPAQREWVRREVAKPEVAGDLGEIIARLFGLSDK